MPINCSHKQGCELSRARAERSMRMILRAKVKYALSFGAESANIIFPVVVSLADNV